MENEIDDVTRKRKLRKGHTSDRSLQLDKNAICDHFLRTVRRMLCAKLHEKGKAQQQQLEFCWGWLGWYFEFISALMVAKAPARKGGEIPCNKEL